MSTALDFVALQWLGPELQDTLGQARQALDSPGDGPALCQALLHQAQGALQLLDVPGAAWLVAEMERLAQTLASGKAATAQAAPLLKRAALQVPVYLQRVHLARRDLPLVLLPLINELRAARGAQPLADTQLVHHALQVPAALSAQQLAERDGPGLATQLQHWNQALQDALAGLLREPDEPVHLEQLGQVYAQLEHFAQDAPLQPLWQVAAAVAEAVALGLLADSRSLYELLCDTAPVLARLAEEGAAGLNRPADPELLRGLREHLGKARGPAPRLQAIARHHGLGEAPLDIAWVAREREYLNGPDRDALRSVVAALCDDLVRHKERLEAFVRSDRQHPAQLAELLPPLRQVADTLAVLGFEQPRRVIIDQLGVIQSLAQGQTPARDAELMDAASALVYVENTLAGMAGPVEGGASTAQPTTDIQQIHLLVFHEVLVGLEHVKACINDGQLSGWSAPRFQALFELIDPLRGALAIIPLPRASQLLALANRWVAERVHGEPPATHALEHFAEALSALEYYLQRLLLDPAAGDVASLDQARDALAALGLEPAEHAVPALDERPGAAGALGLADLAPLASPPGAEPLAVLPAGDAGDDEPLLAIFQAEALGHVTVLGHFIERVRRDGPAVPEDDLHRALHTLKGSAYMAGVASVAELAAGLDLLSREYKAHQLPVEPADTVLLEAALVLLRRLLRALPGERLAAPAAVVSLVGQLRERCAERLAQWAHVPATGQPARRAPPVMAEFLAQGLDTLLDADTLLREWRQQPQARHQLAALLDALTTLTHGAHAADLHAVDELCEALLDVYGAVEDASLGVGPVFFDQAEQAHEALIDMFDQLAAGQGVAPAPERVAALRNLHEQALTPGAMGLVEAASGQPHDWPTDLGPGGASEQADTDQELLQVFLDEGFDIVESAGAALLRWQAEPGNTLEVENLLRDLHTLKGGARMVEIAPLGDLAHELETLYERLSTGMLQASAELFKLLQKGHDRLGQMLDAVRSGQPVLADQVLLARVHGFGLAAHTAPGDAAGQRPVATEPAPALLERGPTDMVKVTAQVLEDLGNLAGEAAIARGRVEQQVNDTRNTLREVDMTLQRMRDQLLRLDSETDAGQREQTFERAGYEDFDPLEMDRHSQLQQLTRALFESVSDLLDLKDTLDDRTHEAQALLAHQARVSSQLQEGLMRTRMVPFERVVPRLQRIVRQVAEELGKQVNFETGHAEAEIDRTVLERMIAPLEHMLRNAVDHGLEAAEVRRAMGKPEAGLITLEVTHEGAEVVIELADDGAGVPLDAVRSKAVKRGLLGADSDMSDHDVMQFILQPGFSTAQKITQISGRGLGMDVVHEEVKQLGGSMTIDSRRGVGARFQIRLPLAVSINRALLVQCGEQLYAVPLNSIEGIVRVKPAELDAHYRHHPPRYRYGGITHDLRYLGQLLHSAPRPELLGEEQALPVLLVRSHDHQVAVQVDAINGSREIVVKSLGPQFSAVPGLNGATILGDGRVVLILDLLGQIRAQHLRPGHNAGPLEARNDTLPARPRLVLVVDDSVTVRKVTSRLLERHGMRVLTARDGVEAMAILQEHRPDVLLLDIEMPRMDGFEVASKVRNNPHLSTLPIIMITSRTGEKHRERAMAIGVNEYLGKPFQEAQLLSSIAKWSRLHA
ncbi:response regulator [Pseudomonas typographi]|uniref:hybrid sensor histidine kinase/response regulator n=1 Tax=Pseudomonas typographi TaxID=2715964 RepID=UPI0016865BC2|nr:response regulator [Pseudomonas typographi]